MSSQAPRMLKCPTCRELTPFTSENPWRPFCSQRCKLIDLGQWANEQYRVPGEAPQQDDQTPH